MHTNIKKKVLKKEYEVTFNTGDFQGGGDTLKLVGSFNGWDTATDDEKFLLKKGRNKKFKNLKLNLPAGEYQYKYFDPQANAFVNHEEVPSLYPEGWVSNEFGTHNAQLSLPEIVK